MVQVLEFCDYIKGKDEISGYSGISLGKRRKYELIHFKNKHLLIKILCSD